MLDFRIRTFLAVCQTLNYTRAAEKLSLTQPAVSQHIAYLEKSYGVKLFAYAGKKLALTPEGELLRSCAEGVEHEARLLERALSQMENAPETFSVGATLTAGEYILARPLARWLAAHPQANTRVVQGDTARLLDMVERGDLDFALIEGYFDKEDFDWTVLCSDKFVGVCSPGSALARQDTMKWEDLLDEHLIVREPGSGTRALLDHALRERNLAVGGFARVTEVESLNIIKLFVGEGLGISFMYEAAVRDELARGSLARIPLEGPCVTHEITFVCQKGGVLRNRLRSVIDELSALL